MERVSKNIIFVTLSRINSLEDHSIYSDLLKCFLNEGYNITIVSSFERRTGIKTRVRKLNNITFLDVRTLNIQKSNDNKKLLGTAGCIRKAIPLLEDNFFVTYGDTYLPVNFKNIQKSFEKQNAKALIAVYKNNNKFGSSNVCFEGKNIFYKKNSKSKKMNFIEYGVSVFSKEIFNESKFKNLSDLSDIISLLSKRKKLKHYVVKKRFYEIGSIVGLRETKNYFRYNL